MGFYELEPRPCDRARRHGRHEWVESPTSRVVYDCLGHDGAARNLAELLERRPELGDLTAAAVNNRLGVSAA